MAHGMTRREFAAAAGAASLAGFGLSARAQGCRHQDLALYRPVGSARPRPDLDDRVHHPQPRLHGLRYAVRDRRQVQAAPADGRRLQHLAGQAALQLHVCATGSNSTTGSRSAESTASPRCKRWMVRDAFGQTLATVVDEMTAADDKRFHDPLERAVPATDRRHRQGVEPGPVHHARAARQDRPVSAGHRNGRVGSVQIRQGRIPARSPWSSMSRTPIMCRAASRRAGPRAARWSRSIASNGSYMPDAMTKAAALASGEVDWWENPPPDVWPILAANPDITLRRTGPARLDGVPALQSPAPAFRQREDAPSRTGGRRPGRFHDRIRRATRRIGSCARPSSPAARRWRAMPARPR